MTTMPGIPLRPEGQPRLASGGWRVDPGRSYASFAVRAAGRSVRGRLPLTGQVLVAEPIEDSTVPRTGRVSVIHVALPLGRSS